MAADERAIQPLPTDGIRVSFTLAVRKGAAAVEFYKRAFGATEIHRVESPDGDVVAQLDIGGFRFFVADRSEEHTSELQSRPHLVCRLLLEKKKTKKEQKTEQKKKKNNKNQ